MRKLLFLIPLFALSSCALLHFFSPSANNTLNQPQWNTMHSLSDISDARYYSITVDDSDRVYTAVYSTTTMKFAILSASELSEEWATNLQSYASSIDALKIAYNSKWNLTFATQSSGPAQIVFRSSSSGWSAFGSTFSAVATPEWDYFFNNNDVPFVLTISSTSFLITTNDKPDVGGSAWVQYQSFNQDVGYNIMDYSADVDSHGNVFVGTGDFNNSQIYFNGEGGVCASYNIPDGREYAKIAVDGNDNLYVIYKSTDDQIKARIMRYTYPDISDNGAAITLYNESFFVGPNHKLGLSVAADKNSSRIYIGFITFDNHKPMVIKIENGNATPMPQFPEYLTNCDAIKLAVNQDGLPVAAVLQPPTLHIFQTWN